MSRSINGTSVRGVDGLAQSLDEPEILFLIADRLAFGDGRLAGRSTVKASDRPRIIATESGPSGFDPAMVAPAVRRLVCRRGGETACRLARQLALTQPRRQMAPASPMYSASAVRLRRAGATEATSTKRNSWTFSARRSWSAHERSSRFGPGQRFPVSSQAENGTAVSCVRVSRSDIESDSSTRASTLTFSGQDHHARRLHTNPKRQRGIAESLADASG